MTTVISEKVAKKTPRPASIIHPYDILDSLFPASAEATLRKEKHQQGKGRLPTPLNLQECERFVLTKGFLCSILQAVEALGEVTLRMADPNFTEHKSYVNSHAAAPLRTSDIPKECSGFSSEDWLCRILAHYTGTDIIPEQAPSILHETRLIRTSSFGMSQGGRGVMMKEQYIIGQNNIQLGQDALQKEESFLSDAKRRWFDESTDPFQNFNFSVPPKDLDLIPRGPCPKCRKLSHLYCAECLLMSPPTMESLPTERSEQMGTALDNFLFSDLHSQRRHVKLPINIELVHHPQEKITKSTGLHACLTSPTQARLVRFPDELPDYSPEDTVVLFPTADAVELSDANLDFSKIKRAVVIEATWQKANTVVQHPKIVNLPKIKLTQRISTFWRHQELGNQFLSTLEAIYYLCVEAYERQLRDHISSPVEYISPSTLPTGVHPTYCDENGAISAHRQHILPEQQYAGQFDDVLLLYANRQQRVHSKYKNLPQAKVPRVWRSKHVGIDDMTESDTHKEEQ